MFFIVIWMTVAAITALVAAGKGRSPLGWAILGTVFGVFALLIVAVLPNLSRERAALLALAASAAPPEDGKTCPQCAETVRGAAVKCRFCGYDFAPLPAPEPATAPSSPVPPASAAEPGSFRCRSCGMTRRRDWMTCPHCQAPA